MGKNREVHSKSPGTVDAPLRLFSSLMPLSNQVMLAAEERPLILTPLAGAPELGHPLLSDCSQRYGRTARKACTVATPNVGMHRHGRLCSARAYVATPGA